MHGKWKKREGGKTEIKKGLRINNSEFCPMAKPDRETGVGVCKLHSRWLANKVLIPHSMRPRQECTCDLVPNPWHSC